MIIDLKFLREKIYGEYGNQAKFSRAIGWNVNTINRILSGKRIPDVNEAAEIANALHLTIIEYRRIFLPNISPYGDKIYVEGFNNDA